jgi:hypothetical protein
MKGVVGRLLLVLIFTVAGVASLAASEWGRRLAAADRHVVTLAFRAALSDYGSLEESFGLAARMPWVGDLIQATLHGRRVTAHYWLGEYPEVAPRRSASGELIDRDPTLMLLTANAAYRDAVGIGTDRQNAIRRLDRVVTAYTEVLQNNPGHVDAAYNLEYVAKLRARWATARTWPERRVAASDEGSSAGAGGQLPPGETIHGIPGSPPPTADTTQFKMMVPKDSEENRTPGSGAPSLTIRKG